MILSRIYKYFHACPAKLIAPAIACVLMVCDYFVANMSYPIFDSTESLGLLAYLRPDSEHGYGDLMAVDISLDKTLVEVYDEYGDSAGRTPVTDRSTLLRFLRTIADANYRYIYVDIRFEEGLNTPADTALFGLMAKMPRLVYSTHRDMDESTHPLAPVDKAGYADYRHVRLSGFTRYEFLQDGEPSVALRMYRDLDSADIKDHGIYYTDGGALCYNTQFVDIPRSVTDPYTADGEIRYPRLGSQLLAKYTPDELQTLVNDKIVVIGDYVNDTHDCYIGSVPGPLLSYYGYLTLHEGRHRINVAVMLLLFVVYTVITYFLLTDRNWPKVRRPMLAFILSLIGWGVLLNLLKVALFMWLSMSIGIFVPTLIFSAIPLVKQFNTAIHSK